MKLKFIIDQDYDKQWVKDVVILKKIDNLYDTSSRFLDLTKSLYQKSWDEINDDFSEYVENITGHKWFYDTYECIISVIHTGMSNWGYAPKIVRTWKENPYFMRRITAHELILSHFFEIIKRKNKKSGLTDGQIWALAEITAFCLTSLSPEVKKFWPWDTEFHTNHNYPHIVALQNQMKEIFLSMKNFDEYIEKGIALVKKYPNMNPRGL